MSLNKLVGRYKLNIPEKILRYLVKDCEDKVLRVMKGLRAESKANFPWVQILVPQFNLYVNIGKLLNL